MSINAPFEVIQGVLGIGQTLIDRLFPDKIKQAAERAAAERELLALHQSGKTEEMAVAMSAILAEAQSPDPWTSRARPTFLYVIYVMILASLPMGVLSAFEPEIATRVAAGMQAWLAAIPSELYALFGVGYVGYAYQRTVEKRAGVAR
jgi:hypothetical protein